MSPLKQATGNKPRPRKPGLHTADTVWRGRRTSRELTITQVTGAMTDLWSQVVAAQGREGFLGVSDIWWTMYTAYFWAQLHQTEKGGPCLVEDQQAPRLKGVTVDGGVTILGADRCGWVQCQGECRRRWQKARWGWVVGGLKSMPRRLGFNPSTMKVYI